MLYYVAGAVFGTVGACYLGIKLFCPWLLIDLRYILKVLPYISKFEAFAKRGAYLIDVFEEQVVKSPDKIFLLYQDEKYTYKEVNEKANQLARAALDLGLKKGDTVAMMVYNEPAFLWTYLGMMKIGVVTSMINTNLRDKPLQHSINISATNTVLLGADIELHKAVAAILPEFPDLIVYTSALQTGFNSSPFSTELHDKAVTMTTENPDHTIRADIKPSDPVVYIFTSGTTGLPKAACVSKHKSMAGLVLGGIFGITEADRIFTCLPLYHSSALLVAFTSAVVFGATFVLEKKFSKSRFLDVCRKHGVTVVTYIGEMCRYLLTNEKSDSDTQHSIRLALGNGLRQDIFREFRDRFQIRQIGEFYASTEGSAGMLNSDGVVGACGRISPLLRIPLPMGLYQWNVKDECLVRDKKGLCVPVPVGTPGLLLSAINKTQVYQGYKGKKELTESKVVRNVVKDGDTYYNTGDMMVQDKLYYVYFSDRIGDTFRWKAENVSTTEVSNCLTDLDFVVDASVYGVAIPGHDGKAGMATLLIDTSVGKVDDSSLKRFHQHCRDILPAYARPMFLRIHPDDLDMTSTLKQNKVRLKMEGFNVNDIKEELYYFDKSTDGYKRLTDSLYDDIIDGKVVF